MILHLCCDVHALYKQVFQRFTDRNSRMQNKLVMNMLLTVSTSPVRYIQATNVNKRLER